MNEQISESFNISITLAITAIVIGIISTFGYIGKEMYRSKLMQNSANIMMEAKYELYDYDNRIVKGSDVINVIVENVRIYDFKIKTSRGTYNISSSAENEKDIYGEIYGKKIWQDDYIRKNILGGILFSDFSSKLIRNETQDIIIGVEFIQEGVE